MKVYFTNRVVNAWNSLPDHVVLSETINTFKSRLDKFWQHQDMIYDFQAELHGTGSRSLHEIAVYCVINFIVCGHRGDLSALVIPLRLRLGMVLSKPWHKLR